MLEGDTSPEVTQETAPRVVRRSIFDDPLVKIMGVAAIGIIIFYLAVILSALYMGVLGNRAPQTATELTLNQARAKVQGGSTSERDWAVYAQSLIASGQYRRAQSVIDQAKKAKIVDIRAQHLALAQSRLFFEQKEYASALKAADEGMKALKKQQKKDRDVQLKSDKPSSLTALGLGENYYAMLLVKADALQELKRDKDLIKALDEYLEESARAADILEWRGDVHARLGNTKKAVADYEEARRYTADKTALNKKLQGLGVKDGQ